MEESDTPEIGMELLGDMEMPEFDLWWSPCNSPKIDEDTNGTLMQLELLNPSPETVLTIANMLKNAQENEQSDPTAAYTNTQNPDIFSEPANDTLTNPNPPQEPHDQMSQNSTNLPEFDRNFIDMNQDDIQNYIDGQQNKNTMKKTAREIAQVTKFLKLKNEYRELQLIPPDELDPLLANYLLSVRKKDGGEFEPSTLRSIVSSIDRKLRRHKYGHTIIINKSTNDDAFRLTREALLAKQKFLKQHGKGNKPRRAEPITDDEINLLYERNLLGDSSPEALLNTVWLNNCIHFGLRGVKEHYTLRLVPVF